MAIEIVDLPIEVIFPLVMLVLPEGIQHLFIIGYIPYPNQTLPYPTLPTVPTCQPGSLSSCLSVCPFVYQCLSLGGCTIGATTKR